MAADSKLLTILDLFAHDNSTLSIDDIVQALDCSVPQAYRYVKTLLDFDYLAKFNAHYILGPKIVQLDAIIRFHDPLIQLCSRSLELISNEYDMDLVLMSQVGKKIISVYHQKPTNHDNPIAFGRGTNMPLLRGAGSKALLAQLKTKEQNQLIKLALEHGETSPLGNDFDAIKHGLKTIKQQGYAMSHAELDHLNAAIAIPLQLNEHYLPTALTAIFSLQRMKTIDTALIIRILQQSQAQILQQLAEHETLV